MALYAFDGTWNEGEAELEFDTNVKKFVEAYRGNGKTAEYIEGVGTRFGAVGRALGGVFGLGGRTRIEEMYEKLEANWNGGDQEIDIIGFSRGAALAVHFANVIDSEGIPGANRNDVQVRFLGLWDVVGSFGIPINFVLKFQETDLGYDLQTPDSVLSCFHAMALNERRQAFNVTRQDRGNARHNVEELWFRGVHSDVGGGNGNTALSNISLQWMMENAIEKGLPLQPGDIDVHRETDNRVPLSENFDPIENDKRVTYATDRYHPTARGVKLEVGESASFTVLAEEQYSWTGVRVDAGEFYAFEIAADQEWKDGDIKCGPDGWESERLPWYKEEIVELLEWRRRCPQANWFELVGSIGDNEENFFRIGKGGRDATYRCVASGELFAFPNDLRTMYGNNHGAIKVTLTRMAEAGGRSLKGCSEE